MKTHLLLWLMATVFTLGTISNAIAQGNEFLISGDANNSMTGGGAFDGTNYLAGFVGDQTSDSSLTVQFFSSSGQLIGSRISLGETGSAPVVAFDGTNYLLVWADKYTPLVAEGNVGKVTNFFGRFLSPAGNFVGNKFTIASNAFIRHWNEYLILFNGSNFFFVYHEDNGLNDYGAVYGRFINKTGQLIGNPIQISSNNAREFHAAFDGTNFLIAFQHQSRYIYGQLVGSNGALVGSNFVIDNSENYSDNPLWVTYGGGNYLVAFHDDNNPGLNPDPQWNLFARFVSSTGTVDANKITICDYLQDPFLPSILFNGTNFLASWISLSTRQIKGQFLNTSGVHIGNEFVVFDSLSGIMPLGALSLHENNKYLAICWKINWPPASGFMIPNHGVYGKFIGQLTNIENIYGKSLLQIYPNPAHDAITINTNGFNIVEVYIYNITGKLVGSEKVYNSNQRVNIGYLDSGVYLFEIKTEKRIERQKLIIQK